MAREKGKPILIYVKEPAPDREKLLTRFLQELQEYEQGHFRSTFRTPEQLSSQIKRDVMREVSKLAMQARSDRSLGEKRPNQIEFNQNANILELTGVVRTLKERIVKRVTEQLDPLVKRYKTMDAVEQGCNTLADMIRTDEAIPDVILGWRNSNSSYHGSEIVTNLLARKLGVEAKIIEMEEIGERRQVVDECLWLRGLRRALVVDDACYSGSTLRTIQAKLNWVDSNVELRFAVLSTLDPHCLPNLYHVIVHNTEELLFPWGWSRLIIGFYDVYKAFGISDRRVVLHEVCEWGSTETIARDFLGCVRLITLQSHEYPTKMRREPNQKADAFLYFLISSAEVVIGDKSGSFSPGEYIFIPRGIGYVVTARDKVQILELLSMSGS